VEKKSKARGEGLDIRQTPDGNVIPGLISREVKCIEEVLELMARGAENRAVGSHDMNEHSSRSHSLLTLSVVGTPKADGLDAVKAKLHLIDLAGSERVSKTDATGERLKEAQVIGRAAPVLSGPCSCSCSCRCRCRCCCLLLVVVTAS
jgi:kinesin family protein C2/C3